MSSTNGKKTGIRERLKETDIRSLPLLVAVGLFVAFIIQRRVAPQEFIGSLLIATLLFAMLYRDMLRYKPEFLKRFRMLVLLGVLACLTIGMGWLTQYSLLGLSAGIGVGLAGAAAFGMPLAAGGMLVTLLCDFHTALAFSFIISLLAGLWQADAGIVVYAFIGSLVGAFSVIRCRKRWAIMLGGVQVTAANVVTVLVLMMIGGELFSVKSAAAVSMAVFSGIAVVALVSLTLPILEKLFKITTDITLLELLDLDQPLMKDLMVAAPGTYHHSVIVGNLVDAVAESVDVNPLFARICAYYHDIGKIKMPEYFIENQSSGISKHDKLTPHMSSMILISHVKEGVEMARHNKLPESVIDIISQHHGTMLMTYFYEKAKNDPNSPEPSEDEYRYPGPKPQSRVAALLMIADAVEAASRVLTDPTPSRIGALVDRIVNHVFLAGQLDECNLTLKDIYEIRRRFTYILTGILHRRIEYPGFDFDRKGEGSDSHDKQPPTEDKAQHRPAKAGLS